MDVQALALADVGSSVRGQVEDLLLADLPDSLVDGLDVIRNTGNALDRPVVGDEHILHIIVPKPELDQLLEEPRADDLEFSC